MYKYAVISQRHGAESPTQLEVLLFRDQSDAYNEEQHLFATTGLVTQVAHLDPPVFSDDVWYIADVGDKPFQVERFDSESEWKDKLSARTGWIGAKAEIGMIEDALPREHVIRTMWGPDSPDPVFWGPWDEIRVVEVLVAADSLDNQPDFATAMSRRDLPPGAITNLRSADQLVEWIGMVE